jgi:hypothetical protein
MMFILMWLIFRTLYIAVLFQDLQTTKSSLPVQTLNESLDLGFVYYMISPTQENIKYLPEVYNRRIVVSSKDSVGIMNQFNDPTLKAGFLGALDTARYANKVKLYGFVLNICNEPLLMRQYGIVFPRNSFLAESFNDELGFLMENGLIDYWMSEHTENIKYPTPASEPMVLTNSHLLGVYELFLICIALSLLAFGFEMISLKVKSLRKVFEYLE